MPLKCNVLSSLSIKSFPLFLQCEDGPGCGEWVRPMIPNPKYKGKWYAPMIDNPAYKGEWKPRQIGKLVITYTCPWMIPAYQAVYFLRFIPC